MSQSGNFEQEGSSARHVQHSKQLSRVQSLQANSREDHSSEYDVEEDMDLVNQDQIYNSKQKKKQLPVARKMVRAQSQHIESHTQPVGPKTKPKYNKKENQGNVLLEQARKTSILKQLCDPNGTITVDSLGHALQKLHIDFDLRDVSDMIGLYWRLKGQEVPFNDEDRITQDQNGEINLSVKLNPQQFKELYKTIRKRK